LSSKIGWPSEIAHFFLDKSKLINLNYKKINRSVLDYLKLTQWSHTLSPYLPSSPALFLLSLLKSSLGDRYRLIQKFGFYRINGFELVLNIG
jgi:hypothetical protein